MLSWIFLKHVERWMLVLLVWVSRPINSSFKEHYNLLSNFPLWFHTQSWHSTCNCKVRNPGWLHLAVCVFFVFLFFIFTFFVLSLRACSTMFTGAYAADRVTQTGQIEGEGLGEAIQPLSFLYFLAYSLITSFVFSVFFCPFVVQISIWMTLAIDGP